MLMLGQLVGQVTGMMIVNQGNRADRWCGVGIFHLVFNQCATNHVADCLGTIDVTLGGDQLVEVVEQAWVYRYSETGKFCHLVLTYVYLRYKGQFNVFASAQVDIFCESLHGSFARVKNLACLAILMNFSSTGCPRVFTQYIVQGSDFFNYI